MDNYEKYNEAFISTFGVDKSLLNDLEYKSIEAWDSVGHMMIIAAIEDSFGIAFEMDDMVDFISYKKGIDILKKHGICFEIK